MALQPVGMDSPALEISNGPRHLMANMGLLRLARFGNRTFWFHDESGQSVRNLNRGGSGCARLNHGFDRLVEDGLLARLGWVRLPDDLDRILLCTVVKKERGDELRKGKVGLELNRRAYPRTQSVASERPPDGHDCGSERWRLLSQRLYLAPQSWRRLLADH